MDPRKTAAEWFRNTVFKDEAIRPGTARNTERVPSIIRAARSLENGIHQSWQSRESVFMKQAKLLANCEDDYDDFSSAACYYPTYQSLTNRQLRGYLSWRTKLRKGDVRKTSLSFAFLYIYELINQIGAADPMDGYRKLEDFRDAYSQINPSILPYLSQWIPDYVIYYGLDKELLSDTPQVVLDQSVTVLEHIQERDAAEIICAVKKLSKWLERSKLYAAYQEDMDAVIVRVLRRISAHYAARCKKTMVEQYFGICIREPVQLFNTAVFCDPLKRRDYQYTVDEQCVYRCKNGFWSVWKRASPPSARRHLDALLKTVDSFMRQELDCRHPVKAELDTKWVLRLIQEEVQGLLTQKKAAEEKKISLNYAQLAKIRQDAAITQEKLIVEEDVDIPEEAAPQEQVPDTPAAASGAAGESPLGPAEYRLLQCLLYGGDTGWVQAEGHLLSVLVDSINEKLYDVFLDCVLDDTPRLIQDYIDALKEMIHP